MAGRFEFAKRGSENACLAIGRCKGVDRIGACVREPAQAAEQARKIGGGRSRRRLDSGQKTQLGGSARVTPQEGGVPLFLGLVRWSRKPARRAKTAHHAIGGCSLALAIQPLGHLAEWL